MMTETLTSETLAQELNDLKRRRIELAQEVAAANTQLAAARENLIRGTSGAAVAAAEAQAAYSALDLAGVELESRITHAHEELRALKAAEARGVTVTKLCEIADKASSHMAKLLAAREAASMALMLHAEEMASSLEELAACRAEFLKVAMTTAPGIGTTRNNPFDNPNMYERIAAGDKLTREVEDAGSDLSAVAVRWAGTSASIFDDEKFVFPSIPYGRAVQDAFNVAVAERAK